MTSWKERQWMDLRNNCLKFNRVKCYQVTDVKSISKFLIL